MTTVAVAGSTFTFGICLYQRADTRLVQVPPTIAAGDFQESTNGAGFNNLDNLPTVTPVAGGRVQIVLSAAETTAAAVGGEIFVLWRDATGAEWCSGCAVVKVHEAEIGADAVLDEVIEGTYTMRQLARLWASVFLGKVTGGGTTEIIFRDLGDTKPRVTVTVDASGNRSAVTLDGT